VAAHGWKRYLGVIRHALVMAGHQGHASGETGGAIASSAMSSVAIRLDAAREEQELRDYLGDRFELNRLWRYQNQLDREFAEVGNEDRFYRTSTGYLYNLTAFAMTGTKLPYLNELTRRVKPSARILDYGCGIGSDGLLLLDAGYDVEFADFDNPSIRYLRWRLARRGLEAPIHNLDQGVPGGFDAAYAFDVIEHVEDPYAFLAAMEARAKLVEVNFLEPEEGDQELHYELPIDSLLAYVSRHRVHCYRVLHQRSHLVMYESAPATAAWRLLSRARIAAGRIFRARERLSRAAVS
jgi:SAM-dependent methyltransferase